MNVSNRPGRSRFPELAADASGELHAFWEDDYEGDKPLIWGTGIFYAEWDGSGWSRPVDVLMSPGSFRWFAHIPAAAADPSGNLHVVWTNNSDLFYSHAPASTAQDSRSWSTPKIIPGSEDPYFSDIAVDIQGTIHVAWQTLENPDIYYSHSTDGGGTWSRPVNVSWCPGIACGRAIIATDSRGDVYLVWGSHTQETATFDMTTDVYFSFSEDGGLSWSDPDKASVDGELSGLPTLAVEPGGLAHILWQEGTSARVRLLHRAWERGAWSPVSEVFRVDDYPWSAFWPSAALDSAGGLHVVWSTAAGTPDKALGGVLYSSSSDGGRSWTPAHEIPGSRWLALNGWSPRPQIAVTRGHELHAVWHNCTSEDECEILASGAGVEAPMTGVSTAAQPVQRESQSTPRTATPTTTSDTAASVWTPVPTPSLNTTSWAASAPRAVNRGSGQVVGVALGSCVAVLTMTVILAARRH